VRVLDLSTTFMAPYATLLMAQMGAEVTKVEAPGGDILRQVGDRTGQGCGPIFLNVNRGKRSIVLDLKNPVDYAVLLDLVADCDVFVHNRVPENARKLRINYEALSPLNPAMIHCGIHGFGDEGPYRDRPAYDDVIQAVSGFADVQTNGGEPQYVRSPVTDKATGLMALAAINAALFERQRSGLGQAIEVPMFESMITFLLLEQQGGYLFDPPQGPAGYARTQSQHRRPYRTADGMISVMVYTDEQWRTFFTLVGRPDLISDPHFSTMVERTRNIDELYIFVSEQMFQRSTAEWLKLFAEGRIPAMPVLSIPEVLNDPHVRAVGLFENSEHPVAGTLRQSRLPVRFSRTRPEPVAPAPLLGEHDASIRRQTDAPS
jgi:crotonobetainyl-CoA:carnitine CoA-transferase CaiB-like acyl-CoA transferase